MPKISELPRNIYCNIEVLGINGRQMPNRLGRLDQSPSAFTGGAATEQPYSLSQY